MGSNNFRATGLIAVAVFGGAAHADHGALGFGVGTAGPIITNTGITLPEGKWFVGERSQYISFSGLSDQKLRRLAEEFEAEGTERHVHSIQNYIDVGVTAGYGVTDDLTLGLVMPYVWRNGIRSVEHGHGQETLDHADRLLHSEHDEGGHEEEESPTVSDLGSSNGIGDLTLFGQYRVFHTDDNATHVSTLFTVKAPTGRTKRVGRSVEGERELLDTHLQPGSGSWGGGLGLAATHGFGRFAVDSSIFYFWATKGAQDTDLGDSFEYNIALSYALSEVSDNPLEAATNISPWTLILELNGQWNDYNRIQGAKDLDTGGNLLFVSPGFRYAGGQNWNVGFSFGIPIVTDTNGYQSEPDFRVFNRINVVF